MAEPLVTAIMLTANRYEMAKQAIESFRRQTYQNRRLFIFDTGTRPAIDKFGIETERWRWEESRGRTVGELRNLAIDHARVEFGAADIIVHWDDDDWSHPLRIEEQVAHLQHSGAAAVGYNEMLFWRDPVCIKGDFRKLDGSHSDAYRTPGEAFIYSNLNPAYALGTSLCYWRSTWTRRPFTRVDVAEDLMFIAGLEVCSGRAFGHYDWDSVVGKASRREPRMVARIHGANTSVDSYRPEVMNRDRVWQRVPEWDGFCRRTFA